MIRDAYKHAAGQEIAQNLVSMSENSFRSIMQSCGDLIDGKTLNKSDLDIGFVAVKWDRGAKNKNIPEK